MSAHDDTSPRTAAAAGATVPLATATVSAAGRPVGVSVVGVMGVVGGFPVVPPRAEWLLLAPTPAMDALSWERRRQNHRWKIVEIAYKLKQTIRKVMNAMQRILNITLIKTILNVHRFVSSVPRDHQAAPPPPHCHAPPLLPRPCDRS